MADASSSKQFIEQWMEKARSHSLSSEDRIGHVLYSALEVMRIMAERGMEKKNLAYALQSLDMERKHAIEHDHRRGNSLRNLVYGVMESFSKSVQTVIQSHTSQEKEQEKEPIQVLLRPKMEPHFSMSDDIIVEEVAPIETATRHSSSHSPAVVEPLTVVPAASPELDVCSTSPVAVAVDQTEKLTPLKLRVPRSNLHTPRQTGVLEQEDENASEDRSPTAPALLNSDALLTPYPASAATAPAAVVPGDLAAGGGLSLSLAESVAIFVCDECGQRFLTKAEIGKHMEIHFRELFDLLQVLMLALEESMARGKE